MTLSRVLGLDKQLIPVLWATGTTESVCPLTPEAYLPSGHIHTDVTSCTLSTCHVFSQATVSYSFGKTVVLFLEEHSRKKSLTPINKYFSRCCQIPTPSSLERILCSVLYETSEDEGDREGHPGDCHPRWSAAQTYLVHSVSWLHVYKQVLSSCRYVCPGCAGSKRAKCVHFPPTSFTG